MNIKIGIFLLSAVCLQMCGLQGINDNNVAVQDQKPKSYVQKGKDFVKKYEKYLGQDLRINLIKDLCQSLF